MINSKNQFGIKYRRVASGLHYEVVEHPLANMTIEEYENYQWPDPQNPKLSEDVKERAKKLDQEGKYAIVADVVESGIFQPCWYLRGFENFRTDMVENKDFVQVLMQVILNFRL